MRKNKSGGEARQGPLSGVVVLDLTSVLMGPYCTQILGDLGADVIKLESPTGDTTRQLGRSKRPGMSGMFINLNRGKRGVVLDLRKDESREVLSRLVRKSDVLVQSNRPKATAKLGIDYASVAAMNPSIVYCNLFGFGRGGRYFGKPAYDDIIQAVSGFSRLQQESSGVPGYIASSVADKVCSLTAAYAIMAALLHREKTGQGQEIDVPMFETVVSFIMSQHVTNAVFDPPLGRPVYPRVISQLRRPQRTATDDICVLIYNDKHWNRFLDIIGRPELRAEPLYATLAARSTNLAEFYALLDSEFIRKPAEEWIRLLDEAEIPVAPLNAIDDMMSDPHLDDVGFWQSFTSGDGELRFPGIPVKFSQTPGAITSGAPTLGEHTAEILAELGFSDAEIGGLTDSRGHAEIALEKEGI